MANLPFRIGPTPNPNSIRVGFSEQVAASAMTFRTVAEAEGEPMAREILGIPGVVQVFMLNDFISINKDPGAEWAKIEPRVAEILVKLLHE